MTARHHQHRANPRRENATRHAFLLWMAAYAAALLIVAALYTVGGTGSGVTIDPDGVRTQQARATGEPQSSLVDRIQPLPAAYRVDG